jgi:uncharacterized protein YbjQ (UPF0145 family)
MEAPRIQVSRKGKIIGTFTQNELEERLLTNELLKTDHCWRSGMTNWEPLAVYISAGQVGSAPNPGPFPPPLPSPQVFFTSTDNNIPGFEVTQSLGVVTGICVRSPTFGQTFRALGQGFVNQDGDLKGVSEIGGQVRAFEELCEQTRRLSFEKMIHSAKRIGADAVIVVRYESCEINPKWSATEVMCYGTAVKLASILE